MGGLRVDVLTLFPRMFAAALDESIVGRARAAGLLEVRLHDFRSYTYDKHHTVDQPPYGAGRGMVLTPEPIVRAVEAIPGHQNAHAIVFTPAGRRLDQARVFELARERHLILICGHYEGTDERVRSIIGPEELSIGDYVLTGGELPAMVLVDAVARLQPGALGGEGSAQDESFTNRLLEHPQYTRPATYRGHTVPEVLLSGHHQRIAEWRAEESHRRTRARRPDLLDEPS